jgi:hypothetical protein
VELRAPMTPPGAWDESADVVVVGFGMAAGALLTSLRERIATARVLVLDRGEVWDPARSPRRPPMRLVSPGVCGQGSVFGVRRSWLCNGWFRLAVG